MSDVGPIRVARSDELEGLRVLEVEAGRVFRDLGMHLVADMPSPPASALLPYVEAGRLWVVPDADDVPVAYLQGAIVDGDGHVDQVSVHPSWSGRGLGRLLVEHCASWARGLRLPALTLTTYRDVPWNGPYYGRLGFVPLPEGEWGPQLRAIRGHEASLGLDAWPRIAMVRPLDRPARLT